MSRSQFQSKRFILRHAWLNLWDERMTTGRINQVAIFPNPSWNNKTNNQNLTRGTDFKDHRPTRQPRRHRNAENNRADQAVGIKLRKLTTSFKLRVKNTLSESNLTKVTDTSTARKQKDAADYNYCFPRHFPTQALKHAPMPKRNLPLQRDDS